MLSIAAVVWAGILAAGCAALYATADGLPARVASHFNSAGLANGYMPRDDYLVMMLVLMIAPALVIILFNVALPRIAPRLVRIPAREYWLAAESRAATYATITASGFAIASMVTAFMIAMHLLVVEANHRVPPRLDSGIVWVLIAVLVAAALGWQFLQRRRFRPPQ
jgi:uncharacterized membrane protein